MCLGNSLVSVKDYLEFQNSWKVVITSTMSFFSGVKNKNSV
jgi:hypothetical protein